MLPGVVMFVLVLTILGLSLFSLSGYEAQFMAASQSRAEAFYTANGAIDRARFLLCATKRLESVRTDLGPAVNGCKVDFVIAFQGDTAQTSGPVQWAGSAPPVTIRAGATKYGQSRVVEADFDPGRLEPYDRLLSLSSADSGLKVPATGNAWYSNAQTRLDGVLWQTYKSPGWEDKIFPIHPSSLLTLATVVQDPPVPPPLVQDFLSAHLGGASTPDISGGVSNNYFLNGLGAPVRLFRTTLADDWGDDPDFSLGIETGPIVDIRVNGTVVWMFDAGFKSKRTVRVTGSGNPADMLVLCARGQITDYEEPRAGVTLHGGLDSPTVPVIIVSDGYVNLDSVDNDADGGFSQRIPWLNIYAPNAVIRGPDQDHLLWYSHPPFHPAQALLEKLFNSDALPNASGIRGYLTYQPGSWREVSGSSPN